MALLIFDLDDTLYKCEELTAKISERIAQKFREVAKLPEHVDVYDEFKRQRRSLRDQGLQVSSTHLFGRLGVSREEFFDIINSVDPREHIEFDEKTHNTMKSLAEDHELVLLSNSPRKKVDRTLEALRIKEHFTKVYGADDWHDSKPNPDILKRIIDEMGYQPEETFNIGDDLDKEIRIAKELGMNTILVKHWPYTEDELAEAHHVVEDIHEVPAVLKKFINK